MTTDQQWQTLAASRGPGAMTPLYHLGKIATWRAHDLKRGIEIGTKRERSRLVGALRRAYVEGRDAGWLSVLLVWCALVVWGSVWGRR